MQAPLPGVEQLLRDAYDLGLKIGLASSSSCDWVQMHLSRLDLIKFFDCIYGKDDVRITKPDPELYESVLQALGARPDEAIVFEDSPNGILAAKRAGIFCVAVPNHLTQQLQLDQADLRLDSLADLSLQEILLAHQRSST
jgi:HAD superfamily hydrolase (TIGR01509 family)